jgi:hypothetical protein
VQRQGDGENVKLSGWRWLKMRDQCSTGELAIRLNVNSQVDAFERIHVGNVLLLTNLQVQINSAALPSQTGRSVAFHSTFHTQVYTEDELPNLPQARKVQKWAKTARAKSTAAECASLMLPFYEFNSFRHTFPLLEPVPYPQLAAVVSALRARENKWFIVQGKFGRVRPAVVR